ncbi:MAG: ATP synthase F1 subunit delta [Phycisphaerae bacterium]|nr:ATP synthase F1 subunit delta [Phycisphaerae bacterium]
MSNGSATALADVYAHSLLDLAEQEQVVDLVETDLEILSSLLKQEPTFQAFLASPYFTEQTKRDLVSHVFSGRLHQLTLHFLAVAIDHSRGMILPEMIDRYTQLYRARAGRQTVTAVVARALPDDHRAKLTQDLTEALHGEVDLEVRVDPSLLGGIILRYGDKMLDNSIRGRLARAVSRITHPERRQLYS